MTDIAAALTEAFDRRPNPELVPAASVAVLSGGELTNAAFGARPSTLFQAASISKPVAAATALRLVADGVLDLDEDVNAYLKSWRMPAPDGWGVRITLRHLLSHGGQLTVHGFPGYAAGAPVPDPVQIVAGAGPANTSPVRPDGVPGVAFRYSGGGYQVLQILLQDVTGRPYPELAREYVFGPAGMAAAGYDRPGDGAAAVAHVGGVAVEGGWHVYPEKAAAGMWCTPADLVRLAGAVASAASGRDEALLPRGTAEAFVTEQVPGMGLGMQLFEGDRFGHTGDNHGYQCVLVADRAGDAAAVMTNSDSGLSGVRAVLDVVCGHFGWPDSLGGGGGVDAAAWAARRAGVYRTGTGVLLRIEQRDGWPHLLLDGQPPLVLGPTGESRGYAPYVHVEVVFDGAGRLTLRQYGSETVAEPIS